jgi:hypothetical protein
MSRIESLLHGPYPRLPRPLDWCSDQWSALRPRVRLIAALAALAALLVMADARVRAAESRWGGAPRPALVATRTLAVGAPADAVQRMRLPPAAVPANAVTELPPGARLAYALPQGAVVTADHIDPRGAAAGLPAGLRAVPVPAEEGWGVAAGGWVDVWVLGSGDSQSQLVAQSRPVLEVREDSTGLTALIGLAPEEVAQATAGLALGGVLLAHAPAP